MDKGRVLQVLLTLAVIGSLALVAGALVTNGEAEWGQSELAAWRASQPATLGQGAARDQAAPAAP